MKDAISKTAAVEDIDEVLETELLKFMNREHEKKFREFIH